MDKSAGKVMAMVFRDHVVVRLVDITERGTTVNAVTYCATPELL
jgi:hypothetical protein